MQCEASVFVFFHETVMRGHGESLQKRSSSLRICLWVESVKAWWSPAVGKCCNYTEIDASCPALWSPLGVMQDMACCARSAFQVLYSRYTFSFSLMNRSTCSVLGNHRMTSDMRFLHMCSMVTWKLFHLAFICIIWTDCSYAGYIWHLSLFP